MAAALILVVLSACTPRAPESPTTAASDQAARPAPTKSPDVPNSLAPEPEESQSPSASATVDRDAQAMDVSCACAPWWPYGLRLLVLLGWRGATARFFVVGEMVAQHPDLIKKIVAGGHAIGKHTWDHSDLTTLSDPAIRDQFKRTARAVGPSMAACMRPPYGSTNERVRAVTKDAGYKTILWTDWAVDWDQPPIPEFLGYLEDATYDKSNILLHDGGGDRPNTVEAVRIMLPRWIKRGFTFQAVPQCLVPHSS